ncbi:MAG: hypothetical protein JKY65_09245 [Planctomycetes bacterium]|nr:hypothetical protein [Planctomycetota bacterium]
MTRLSLALTLTLLAGCAGSDPVEEAPPQASASETAEAKPQQKKKAKKRRKRVRTKKGRSKRKQREARAIPEGHVYLAFTKADLKTQVLPVVSAQAGVEIVWRGDARRVHLPLKRTLPWLDAMDLICRFSDTHLVRAYTGRYELRDGYQGQLSSEGITTSGGSGGSAGSGGSSAGSSGSQGGATASKARKGSRGRSSRGTTSSSSGTASSASTSTAGAYKGTYDPRTGVRPPNEAKAILQGMGTRNSGGPRR